jgi:hypothetical protein
VTVATRRGAAPFIIGGLIIALVLAAIVSGFASSEPDGLERVAEDEGFLDTAEDHDLADSPVADYSVDGVDDERVSTGLAGVIGVASTFALGYGAFVLMRRRRSPEPDTAGTTASPPDS